VEDGFQNLVLRSEVVVEEPMGDASTAMSPTRLAWYPFLAKTRTAASRS
jgi:hypothetical protein